MRTALRIGLAVLALGACAGSAGADKMSVYYHVGSWDAFSGPGDDGKPVCGAGSTNPVDNRSFSMRFQLGSDAMQFQAKKPTWNIPADTQIPVVMQLGLDSPWTMQATGSGQTVEWSLDRTTVQLFDEQFRRNRQMTLTFPSGNEPSWTIGLNGSTAVSNAFGRCVADMAARAGTPSATQSGPTQPFGQEPTQPAPQTPTQPNAARQ